MPKPEEYRGMSEDTPWPLRVTITKPDGTVLDFVRVLVQAQTIYEASNVLVAQIEERFTVEEIDP